MIFAFEESPSTAGLLWTGSDDGRVHVSRDNGANWSDVTPGDLPAFGTVNAIDPSRHDPGRATIAVHKYRENDFTPYIFQTNDYGKSWKRLTSGTNGIPSTHFVRVVREDPDRKGLLYAGTEYGIYASFDNGAHWQSLQLNLPVTPVTDLAVHQKDLVLSTQGRAFWILDDLSALHQVTDAMARQKAVLLKPRDAYRNRTAPIRYYFAEAPKDEVQIEILDAGGAVVSKYSAKPVAPGAAATPGPSGRPTVTLNKGMNTFTWDVAQDPIVEIPTGTVLWGGLGSSGPVVAPGAYQVRITSGAWTQTQPIVVKADPRYATTPAEYQEQQRLSREIGGRLKELYERLATLRDAKKQSADLGARLEKAGKGDEVTKAAKALAEKVSPIEKEMTQVQGEGGQDALNFPGMLDNQILEVYSEVTGDETKVSKGTLDRWTDLQPAITDLFRTLRHGGEAGGRGVQRDGQSQGDRSDRHQIVPALIRRRIRGGRA